MMAPKILYSTGYLPALFYFFSTKTVLYVLMKCAVTDMIYIYSYIKVNNV